jgi:superfamily II DNA or RNA helicase
MSSNPDESEGEIERLRKENEDLKEKLRKFDPTVPAKPFPPQMPEQLSIFSPGFQIKGSQPAVTNHSSIQEKIALFRNLFRGREDVYAERWESSYTGKKGYSPACANKWDLIKKNEPKKYFQLTDPVVYDHLMKDKTIGVYPLLPNSRCCFLACDFDKQGWQLDALGYLNVCKQYGIPAYLERSRSGNGAHVWIFFSASVEALKARRLGISLLRQTMEQRAELDLASYDRFFPNQDFTPQGGFGNLIALPLQKRSCEKGNTEFLNSDDVSLKPWPDQWAFLSQAERISPAQLEIFLQKVPALAVGVGTMRPPSPALRQKHPAPKKIRCTLGAMFSIEKSGIPPWLLSQLKHAASLWNPAFFKKQKMRYSTYNTPRFIKCYEEDMSHLHLPRGISEEVLAVVKAAESELVVVDQRPIPAKLSFQFHGQLTDSQEHAMRTMLSEDIGVLVAPPGAGKTVMGCYAIAKRGVPTLVLSHRKPILEQWRTQLMTLLQLTSAEIGQVGGGKDRQTEIVDLGMLQSLQKYDPAALEAFFAPYGFAVIDECHHIPAVTFEASLKRVTAKYILGLTATPKRSDDLGDIIPMQCGPIRCRMGIEDNGISRQFIVRETALSSLPPELTIQEVFKVMARDEARNHLIHEDVLEALSRGRKCILLSSLKEHCKVLAENLAQKGKRPFLLSGTMGKKERTAILDEIKNSPSDNELLIIATGQYLGEGFDCPQVDTLFLAFPVSYPGKLIQYVGRILRTHPGKESVIVYDYVDKQVPVLNRMCYRRSKAYQTMKFNSKGAQP